MMQRHRINLGVDAARRQQRRQTGGEAQAAGHLAVVQGLDAQTVARQQQTAAVALPEGEGEHALQMAHAILAPGVIGLEDDFGVAVGEKVIATLTEFGAQLPVVVDGTVEDDAQPQRAVDHGLLGAVADVDDLEAAMAAGDGVVLHDALAIRPARAQALSHPCQALQIGADPIETYLTGNSAHPHPLACRA
jgi:hypothetical protein